MSLEPVKPALANVPTAISEAPKKHGEQHDEDETPQEKDKKNTVKKSAKKARDNTDGEVRKIVKSALEAEASNVNILDENGQKRLPDISGMVINILT